MENKRKDYTDGDHSLKNWFKIMWQNGYIFIFIVFFTVLIIQLFNLDWCIKVWKDCNKDSVFGTIAATISMILPISGVIIVSYKGFYQYEWVY